MWIRDINTGKWSVYTDKLSKDNYDNLKQDLESIKFYSNCLSGATYLLINQLDNIYETLGYKDESTWFISSSATSYTNSPVPPMNGRPIDKLSIDDYFTKYTKDYGFTLKTLFTPEKLIKEEAENFIEVDVATVPSVVISELNNLTIGAYVINLTIDGIRLKEGHRVLVKDQVSLIELANFVDPDTYFVGPYYILETSGSSTTYYYYNDQNGIYKYTNSTLVRESDLNNYDDAYNFSVVAKLGDINRDKQFHLHRKSNGYYPIVSNSEPIDFQEKHNWVLRNRVDYNNILDSNYYDVLKHATQSYSDGSYTYSIPQRTIAVGEFGVILNNQGKLSVGQTYSLSHIINNRYKVNLRGVSQTSGYYWVCGEEGTILKVSKVDFSITKIKLDELRDFRAISFFNDTRGVAVGKFNNIWYTEDGGYHWKSLNFTDFDAYSYNKILFTTFDNFFVIGDNGVFIEFSNSGGQWISYLRKITKVVKKDDVYPLVDDLTDIVRTTFTSWNLTYSTTQSSHTISTTKDVFLISGSNDNLIVYDYNNFVKEHDFMYLAWGHPVGDIKSISAKAGTNDVYIGADDIYKFNMNEFKTVDVTSNLLTSSGVQKYRTDLLGTAYLPSNLGSWTQITPTGIYNLDGNLGLTTSGGFPLGKSWQTLNPTWSSTQSFVPFENSTDSWTKAITLSMAIQKDSVIDFYSPVTYYGGSFNTTSTYLSYASVDPNWLTKYVGYMDRLWLVGRTEDNKWELISECDQILDSTYGIPAYSLRGYRFSKNYNSLGFVVNQDTYVNKVARGYSGAVPVITFFMGEIIEFTVTVDKPTLVADYYANKMYDFDGVENIVVGNNALARVNDYSNNNYLPFDPTFGSKLKSKMLFLDYDVASKLNFFDDSGEYRLPSSATFSTAFVATSSGYLSINNLSTEYNWLNYYKDGEKTFQYYSSFDDSNVVDFSSTFSYHSSGSNTFIFSKSVVSIGLSAISQFAPTIATTQSRYVAGATALPASPISSPYSVFFYKYLAIFKRPTTDPVSVGDILYFNSDVVETTLVVNRILTLGSSNYIYCYTDFNDSIINSISKLNSDVTVTNLNKYKTISELVDRFDFHPISIGYKLDLSGSYLSLSTRFNNKTAYYNMQSEVLVKSLTYSMVYSDTFLKFGYSPTYNILDYLGNIDSNFNSSRVMYSMPIYQNMPGNNGNTFTPSNIYIDGNVKTNKLLFGTDFEFEWTTIWINTFVDVTLVTNSGTYLTERCLVVNKYYDSSLGGYIVEFDKGLLCSGNLIYVTIASRNTLQQISDDLQLLNNIQRTSTVRNIQSSYTFTNLHNNINSKFNTDSYCKILLSDQYIKTKLSAIIYTDYKYQLSMNVVNLEKQLNTNIISTQNYGGYLQIVCDKPHGLSTGDGVVLTFNGGTYSSQFMNPQYNGFQAVSVLNDTEFVTSTQYGVSPMASDTGYVQFTRVDAFFNYQPTDIYDLGSDKISKVAVEITPINIQLVNDQYNLINLDLNKYKYELFDGLTIGELIQNYHWVLEAEISNAKIGKSSSGIVWYSGVWKCGRWFGGTWISGTWIKGDFYDGIWNARETKDKVINVEIGNQTIDNLSKWYDGRWFDGTWFGGKWYNGRRYAGDWYDGIWYNGIWNDGTWYDGLFSGGIWVLGDWKAGIFNSDNKPSYWLDGVWYSGDFENGRWFNGEFRQESGKKSRFGIKASNSRNAIWDSGRWLSGEFHSLLNTDDNGNLAASDIHKYSYWKTGIWNQGDFYGGIVFNIDFRGGAFHGGIVDDIQVMGIDTRADKNEIVLNGIFRFNIGDEVWLVDDGSVYSQYSNIGSLSNPKKYKIAYVTVNDLEQTTKLKLIYDLSSLGPFIIDHQFGIDLRLRVVSKFSNATWYSGLWYNGVFDGTFYGGMWYNGVFQGEWGQ
jgi:hypothetical protein